MADKEKKVAKTSDVEKATTDESKAAAKVAKAAKGNANKKDKPNFFVRTSKGTKQFFKDFKGECKKIVWPDAKTVLKSTAVVLAVVAVCGVVIYGIDQLLIWVLSLLQVVDPGRVFGDFKADETTTQAVTQAASMIMFR